MFWLACSLVGAAESEPRPLLAPGATRDEVIDVYGWPTGQSKLGAREILSYPQGTVHLQDGRVESVDFTMKPPWPPPRPRPDWAVVAAEPREPREPTETREVAVAPAGWLDRHDEALREATRRNLPILVLLLDRTDTGASRRFDEEVARQPEFGAALQAGLVLVWIDFGAIGAWPAEVRDQHEQLRAMARVQTFPALRLLGPDGALRAEFDLAQVPAGDGLRAGVISAVQAARNHLFRNLPESVSAGPAVAGSGAAVSARSSALDTSLLKARRVVLGAIAVGIGGVGFLFWLMWRRQKAAAVVAPTGEMARRISDAASGLPSQLDLLAWPRRRLVAVLAAFVEAEGYHADVRPADGDYDLALRRAGSERPQVLIVCVGAEGGTVSAKRVREFFATMTVEAVDVGWYVAPAGFAPEAKEFAEAHRIQLFDGPGLIAQLRELPPLVLPRVLAKALA